MQERCTWGSVHGAVGETAVPTATGGLSAVSRRCYMPDYALLNGYLGKYNGCRREHPSSRQRQRDPPGSFRSRFKGSGALLVQF